MGRTGSVIRDVSVVDVYTPTHLFPSPPALIVVILLRITVSIVVRGIHTLTLRVLVRIATYDLAPPILVHSLISRCQMPIIRHNKCQVTTHG